MKWNMDTDSAVETSLDEIAPAETEKRSSELAGSGAENPATSSPAVATEAVATEVGSGGGGGPKRGDDQMELGLRAASVKPRRVIPGRRYAVARWWFERMRETVRSTRAWEGAALAGAGSEQGLLVLTQTPTRWKGSRAVAE